MILEAIKRQLQITKVTRYQISKETGIDEAVLSRLYHGKAGCAIETADKLCKYLELELKPKNSGDKQ